MATVAEAVEVPQVMLVAVGCAVPVLGAVTEGLLEDKEGEPVLVVSAW